MENKLVKTIFTKAQDNATILIYFGHLIIFFFFNILIVILFFLIEGPQLRKPESNH